MSVPKSPFHLINYVRSTTESPLSAIIKINKIGDHLLMELPKVQIELLAEALSRSIAAVELKICIYGTYREKIANTGSIAISATSDE